MNLDYIIRNLWQRKSRTLITILSIFVGISTIFVFIAFGLGLVSYVNTIAEEAGVDKIIVQVKGVGQAGLDTTFRLEEKDVSVVERTIGVQEAVGMKFRSVTILRDNTRKFYFAVGVSLDQRDKKLTDEFMTIELLEGRDLKKGDEGKIVLGYNYQVPDKIFAKPVEIGEKLDINGQRLRVIGFYDELGNPSDDANIYMSEDDLDALFPDEDVPFNLIVGRVNDVDDIDAVVERVERQLRRSRGQEEGKEDFFVQSFLELLDSFTVTLNIIIGFVILVAFISVIVSAVNTANTMVTSVLERVKEIGVMKSIGARNSVIRNIFLIESGILGGVAGLFGVAVGWVLSVIGGQLLAATGFSFLQPEMPWYLFAGLIFFSAAVGMMSGLIPAIQASRQNPVDAIRYE